MNTQNMSANGMAVKCKEGTRRESTGTTKTGASLFSSDSHKKYLPTYLKTHKSSCHDHCKYEIKYLPELDRKGSSLNNFGKEVKHKDTLRVNNLDLQEARKRVGFKKTLINVDKPIVIKQKALSQVKETRLVKEPIISKKINATGRQAIASKTEGDHDREMTKDIGNMMHESETKGGSHAKEPASSLKKVPSVGRNVLKKAPTKNSTIPLENHRFKQSSLALSKIDSVTEPAKPAKGKTILKKTKGRSLLPAQGSNSLKNEGYNTRTTRGITRNVEERTAKPQVPSHSSKHHDINGSTSKPIVMMNPDVEDVEGKIACAIELQANSNSDGLGQRLLSSMNHESVSVTQTSLNSENDILDSPQDDSPKSECIDLPFLKPSVPEAEYFYLNCIQQEYNNVTSSEYSAVYDEENEEENSAITELSESELEIEKTKTVSVTKTKESDSRISELSEAEYETETITCSGTKTSMSKGRIKESAIVHPEENLSAPYMLRFRRSTTQNSEIGDCDQVGREGLLEMPTLEAVPTDLDPGMSKVALRHQVVHEKKDIQGLFNIVLEETAIKLAENRKNKVQALVEAFETAISLQGKKLASTT